MQNKKAIRHYCHKCGAKRKESVMHKYHRAAFGKYTWECNQCGDSRFKNTVKRDSNSFNVRMQSLSK